MQFQLDNLALSEGITSEFSWRNG